MGLHDLQDAHCNEFSRYVSQLQELIPLLEKDEMHVAFRYFFPRLYRYVQLASSLTSKFELTDITQYS